MAGAEERECGGECGGGGEAERERERERERCESDASDEAAVDGPL
jgi:hypothetical protein